MTTVTGPVAAMAVAATALRLARDQLAGLQSGYVIGSLAHGGFAEATSDLDIAILGSDAAEIAAVAEGLEDATYAATKSDMARRISVFHCAWEEFSAPGAVSRFPAVDRLDLMQNGSLVLGHDLRDRRGVSPPPGQALEESIRFVAGRLGADEAIEALSISRLSRSEPRQVTWTVLLPVRLLFLARTGKVGNNDQAAANYAEAGGMGAELANAAVRWRRTGRVDQLELAELAGTSLVPLYLAILERVGEMAGVPAADELARLTRRLRHADAGVAQESTSGERSMVELEGTPTSSLLLERVWAAARSFGDRDAVRAAGQALTYAELQALSEGIAGRLGEDGVRPGDRVAISVPRDVQLVPLILGILGAGAAIVPLEIRQPPARAQFVCREANVSRLVADGTVAAELGLESVPRIELLTLWEGAPPSPRAPVLLPETIAYVMFTSGSTGKPKGVAVPHAGLANLLSWAERELGADRLRRTLLSTSLSFDVAMFELFAPLAVGGSVTLVDGPFDLASVPPDVAPTLYSMVPSVAAELVDESRFQAGATVVLAGEQVPAALVGTLLRAGAGEVWNCYGPTEATVYSTFARLTEGDDLPPIGRPLASTRAHVLDPQLEPVKSGDRGELFLAGAGVAEGYVNQPGLTADRFLPEPGAYGVRMYRTGDVVRERDDGQLEFLGRSDDQLKVAGVRIEPSEIESALLQHEAVAAAVVGSHTVADGNSILVAYVCRVADGDPTPEELLGHLRSLLPQEMVPSRLVILDAFPRTLSGKVDRRALPAPPEEEGPAVAWQRPSHQLVAEAWESVLEPGIRFGPDDNFFDIGGRSLLLMRLKVELGRHSGRQIRLVDMFRYPTVRSMGAFLDGEHPAPAAERAPSVAGDRLARLRRVRVER